MKHIVLGTAGHIDHGKTSLVKSLTGINTDRLKEEKIRGITIDLGFAYLDLPSGSRLAIVDVPGHEKFIKNMVAGTTGIDLVVLVIASDEGIMPQTREHLNICSLLNVNYGLVVLTKIDLVDNDWLKLVYEDVKKYLQGTFLSKAPIICVSSSTNEGIDSLIYALDDMVNKIKQDSIYGFFRLPVDRVFTVRGFGTVVTGTVLSGILEVGQEVSIYPQGISSRVRGFQVNNQIVNRICRGQRTAINLHGVEKKIITRGNIIATVNSLIPSILVDVELVSLKSMLWSLKHRALIRFHVGTSEIIGRVILLDRNELYPGESLYCQLLLDNPVALMGGDRFILRSCSPVTTIAGGLILHPYPIRHKRGCQKIITCLSVLRNGSLIDRILVYTRLFDLAGISIEDLIRLMNIPLGEIEIIIKDMFNKKFLINFKYKEGIRIVAMDVFQSFKNQILVIIKDFHKVNPLKTGINFEELRQRLIKKLDFKFFLQVLNVLVEDKEILINKEIICLVSHKIFLSEEDKELMENIESVYRKGGNTPPSSFKKLFHGNIEKARQILDILINSGLVVKVKDDFYYHRESLEYIKDNLIKYLVVNRRIEISQFKILIGISRKYLVPLLEYFDDIRLTVKIGNERMLKK